MIHYPYVAEKKSDNLRHSAINLNSDFYSKHIEL